MKLRPYQTDAIAAISRDWQAGISDVLLVAATGAGKTVIFLRLLMDALDGSAKRALILAHRQELIDQPLERIGQIDADWLMRDAVLRPRVGVVMGERDDCDRELVIATVQSLASPKRLGRLLAHGPIDILITDESHHATAPTYLKVYEALKAANPGLLHLGVTATPIRGDGNGLAKVYRKDSARITIADLVKQGYLVRPRWLGISTGLSLAGVQSSGGDFVQSQLAKVFDTPSGRRIIVDAYREYAATRRAIAFTASVAGAHDLAAAFNDAGIPAAAVDGTTPKEERREILAAFRRGEVQVIANCQVLTEGFDAPGTGCILMCRPTRSDSLYVQCMGRGLRPVLGIAQPDEDCLILDFLPQETRNIVMAGDVLGLPKEVTQVALKEQDAEPGEVQAGFTFDGEHFDSSGTPLEIVARELDYLHMSPYIWKRRDGWLTLGLGKSSDGIERILAISPASRTSPQRLVGVWRREGERWDCRTLLESNDFESLSERANLAIEQYADATLSSKERSWQKQPLSDAQRNFLRKLASRQELGQVERLSKGEAAQLITFYQARRILRSAGYL